MMKKLITIFARALEEAGFKVHKAMDGQQAIQSLSNLERLSLSWIFICLAQLETKSWRSYGPMII